MSVMDILSACEKAMQKMAEGRRQDSIDSDLAVDVLASYVRLPKSVKEAARVHMKAGES